MGPCVYIASAITVTSVLFAQAQTNGGYSVNIHNREEVRSFYNLIYLSSEGVPMNSSATVASCNAGTNSYAFRDAAIRRLNFYRAMAGIFANVTEDKNIYTNFQSAAYMCSRNNTLSTGPPNTWTCYTIYGGPACGQANLTVGNGPAAVDVYILDRNIPSAGHRRWALNPNMKVTSFGDAPDSIGLAVNAMSVFNQSNPYITNRDGFVSWPPPGYVPAQMVSPWWSFSISGADFSQASVAVTSNFVPVAAIVQPLAPGFGQNALVWTNSVPGASLQFDTVYTISISNFLVGSQASNVSYSVTLFNLTSPPPTNPLVAITAINSATNDSATGSGTVAISGTVNPGGAQTSARFEFGLTTNYGAATAWSPVGNSTNATPFPAALLGLTAGVLYHVRLVATNLVGSSSTADQTISTPAFFKPGDANGNGLVDQSELNTVLSNYWPTSPWLYITNTGGLGTSNVTFALTNTGSWYFTVESSTNLATWQAIGTATPLYRFLDASITSNSAPRYYRLRWP
jgi:hypothetical protein